MGKLSVVQLFHHHRRHRLHPAPRIPRPCVHRDHPKITTTIIQGEISDPGGKEATPRAQI